VAAVKQEVNMHVNQLAHSLQDHRATALAFERIDPSPCAEMVLFPDMEISEQLAGLLLWVDLAGV
jgi:plastocyanin domain-containing protein